jgi:hypothetical protein
MARKSWRTEPLSSPRHQTVRWSTEPCSYATGSRPTADAAGVSRALAQLGDPQNAELRADRLELRGRLNLLENRPESALPAFRESADLRREAEDCIGMARALALAGEAAKSLGRAAEAADLFFRAGRSAQLEGDQAEARRWLDTAARLAANTGQAEIHS